MKNQNIQKDIETDTEEEDKKKSFREDPEQACTRDPCN